MKYDIITKDNLEKFMRDVVNVEYRLPENKKIFTRVVIPKFRDDWEKNDFIEQELTRCRFGDDLYRQTSGKQGMCGRQYFYFNYCKLDGKKLVEYRVCDNEWYKKIEKVTKEHKGIVCVKRRQSGWSSKEQADMIYDLLFIENSMVGMDSKTEKDSFEFFRKMLLMYDALPDFLKFWDRLKKKDSLIFGEWRKNSRGEDEFEQFSMAYAVAPVDTAHESRSLTKLIDDEAGKKTNLLQKWNYAIEGIRQGSDRYMGVPLVFGTSGEISTTGQGLMTMWYNHKDYDLEQHFVGAWTGFKVDKYGNENIEYAIQVCMDRRNRFVGKDWVDEVQKNPFTPEEAFLQFGESVPWDTAKVSSQLIRLEREKVEPMYGDIFINAGKPLFVPSPTGKVLIYEHPQADRDYFAGSDPADHDVKDIRQNKNRLSNLSTVIAKKLKGSEGNNIVCKYTDRPSNLDEYFLTCANLLTYYNGAKVLVEDNRYRMLEYFEKNALYHLLKTQPVPLAKMDKNPIMKYGFKRTEFVLGHQKELMKRYVDEYCETIPDVGILQQLINYGRENCDDVDALMALLLYMEEEYVHTAGQQEITKKFSTGYKYQQINGVVRRVQVRH